MYNQNDPQVEANNKALDSQIAEERASVAQKRQALTEQRLSIIKNQNNGWSANTSLVAKSGRELLAEEGGTDAQRIETLKNQGINRDFGRTIVENENRNADRPR